MALLTTVCSVLSLISYAWAAGTIIPLYLYPQTVNGKHNWQAVVDAKKKYPTVEVWAIVNPNSGPGNSVDTNYKNAVEKIRAAGIKTLGYIATSYGTKSADKIKAEMDKWKEFYKPNGIFLDEMTYDDSESHVKHYKQLTTSAKQKGFTKVVGNPGTDTKKAYVGSVDTIIIYETDKGFPTETNYAGWHASYDKTNWGILPYNIKKLEDDKVRKALKYVKYIYVTDDSGANPWDSIATYLSHLFSLLV